MALLRFAFTCLVFFAYAYAEPATSAKAKDAKNVVAGLGEPIKIVGKGKAEKAEKSVGEALRIVGWKEYQEELKQKKAQPKRSLGEVAETPYEAAMSDGGDLTEQAARRMAQAGFYCDDSGVFNQALLFSCTNAMRQNPMSFASNLRAKCYADAWLSSISNPVRQPLNYVQSLMNVAQQHSVAQGNAALMTHVVPGELDVAPRIKAAGYNIYQGSENVGYGYRSVLDVMVAWTCSDGHRNDLFACNVHDLGVGVAISPVNGLPYWTQNFGCLNSACYSCSGPGAWQTNIYGTGAMAPISNQMFLPTPAITPAIPAPNPFWWLPAPAPAPVPAANPFWWLPTPAPAPLPAPTPSLWWLPQSTPAPFWAPAGTSGSWKCNYNGICEKLQGEACFGPSSGQYCEECCNADRGIGLGRRKMLKAP